MQEMSIGRIGHPRQRAAALKWPRKNEWHIRSKGISTY